MPRIGASATSDSFDRPKNARTAVDAWRFDYNNARPHTSLGGLTPAEFIRQDSNTSNSRLAVA
jgi:putative transposase